jgi:hypothetical protein
MILSSDILFCFFQGSAAKPCIDVVSISQIQVLFILFKRINCPWLAPQTCPRGKYLKSSNSFQFWRTMLRKSWSCRMGHADLWPFCLQPRIWQSYPLSAGNSTAQTGYGYLFTVEEETAFDTCGHVSLECIAAVAPPHSIMFYRVDLHVIAEL